MSMWSAMLVAGAVTYLIRVLPLMLGTRMPISPRLEEAVGFAALGAMTALCVGGLVDVGQTRGSVDLAAGVVAVLVAGGLALRGRHLVTVMVVGMSVFVAVGALVAAVVPGSV